MEYFKDLEFDLPSALLAQLVDLFERMTPGPLDEEAVLAVPEAQGSTSCFSMASWSTWGKPMRTPV
ncbi:hypothetical protein [Pseudomonas aeruginosa]|uniref:hypothetical protein n=1 Tax=Pseudomonas aeruginosa TaxID=287 RepID=UPI00148DDEBE|nr:hypothetical protein [Pseudomonas aeruginosa]